MQDLHPFGGPALYLALPTSTGDTSSLHRTSLWLTGNKDRVGEFLDYVDPGDWQSQPDGVDSYEYAPTEKRKDMSSPENLQRLKDYARDRGIDWEDVQEGDPAYGQKKEGQ